MENFKINDLPQMVDEDLQQLINELSKQFSQKQLTFANTCYWVNKIVEYYKSKKMYLQDTKGYWYSSTTLLEKFGFDQSTVSKLKSCYERFCFNTLDGRDIKLIEQYQSYSPSKLYELLPLDDESIGKSFEMGLIKPDMTVKEIRKKVKSLINGEEAVKTSKVGIETPDDINEEEIPMVYDPTKEYDFEYFKAKTKNQLLNDIWALQTAYQKLRKRGENK